MTFLSTNTSCNQSASNNNNSGQDDVNGAPFARSVDNEPVPLGSTISLPTVILRSHPAPEAPFQQHFQHDDEYQNLDVLAAIDAALRIIRGEDDDILSLPYATKDHHGHSTGAVPPRQ